MFDGLMYGTEGLVVALLLAGYGWQAVLCEKDAARKDAAWRNLLSALGVIAVYAVLYTYGWDMGVLFILAIALAGSTRDLKEQVKEKEAKKEADKAHNAKSASKASKKAVAQRAAPRQQPQPAPQKIVILHAGPATPSKNRPPPGGFVGLRNWMARGLASLATAVQAPASSTSDEDGEVIDADFEEVI